MASDNHDIGIELARKQVYQYGVAPESVSPDTFVSLPSLGLAAILYNFPYGYGARIISMPNILHSSYRKPTYDYDMDALVWGDGAGFERMIEGDGYVVLRRPDNSFAQILINSLPVEEHMREFVIRETNGYKPYDVFDVHSETTTPVERMKIDGFFGTVDDETKYTPLPLVASTTVSEEAGCAELILPNSVTVDLYLPIGDTTEIPRIEFPRNSAVYQLVDSMFWKRVIRKKLEDLGEQGLSPKNDLIFKVGEDLYNVRVSRDGGEFLFNVREVRAMTLDELFS